MEQHEQKQAQGNYLSQSQQPIMAADNLKKERAKVLQGQQSEYAFHLRMNQLSVVQVLMRIKFTNGIIPVIHTHHILGFNKSLKGIQKCTGLHYRIHIICITTFTLLVMTSSPIITCVLTTLKHTFDLHMVYLILSATQTIHQKIIV